MRNKIIYFYAAFVIIITVSVIFILTYLNSNSFNYLPDDTVNIIIDSDIDTDIDDMGAFAVLHSYVKEGKANILAAVGSCNSGYAAACIDAVNTYYGLPDIPIGISPDCPSSGISKYQKYIAENFPNDTPHDENVRSAVSIYRETLEKCQEKSAVIVVTGPCNNLYDLLCSNADEYSKKTGYELVADKVKLCVIVGGEFPESESSGEYNVKLCPQAADYVSQNCPVSIMWCGFEIGKTVMTGARIEELNPDNPVRVAYELYSDGQENFTRCSWDLIAVMYAVKGKGNFYSEVKGTALFMDHINKKSKKEVSDGYNQWYEYQWGKDAYLVSSEYKDNIIAGVLDELIVRSEFSGIT